MRESEQSGSLAFYRLDDSSVKPKLFFWAKGDDLNRVPKQMFGFGVFEKPSEGTAFFFQICRRGRIWSGMPVQLPQLGDGVEAARHAADDLAGGGPGVAAVVNAAVEGGGQVGFGHGEDFFPV